MTAICDHSCMSEKPTKKGSEVSIRLPDESYSDAVIHEAITARVDDSNIRARSRATLLAAGVPIAVLDKVVPGDSLS